MSDNKAHIQKKGNRDKATPIISTELASGDLVELVYNAEQKKTALAVYENGSWRLEQAIQDGNETLIPYSAENNLIRNNVVLFPSQPEEYGSEDDLITDIRSFIHQYMDLSESFEQIAAYYILFTWVYDTFNELPYLRLRGDYGSGKTRFLLIVGSLCYRPIFASGASTVSPIFHILDRFGGTLIIDEADFRFSDEKSDMVKILNNGNVRGLPVLRTEMNNKKEFNPRAFHVFGPKLAGMRKTFDDDALESRFITEETGKKALRTDIPINLPSTYKEEALRLRNKLLLYRFQNYGKHSIEEQLVDRSIEPRLNQIFAPLLSVVSNRAVCEKLKDIARNSHKGLIDDRGTQTEAEVLTIIRYLFLKHKRLSISLKEITVAYNHTYGSDKPVGNKWVGAIIRKSLNLRTHKSHGIYVLPNTVQERLNFLYERYGVTEEDATQLFAEKQNG